VKPTHSISPHTLIYDPPIPEFTVSRTVLGQNESTELDGVEGPSVLIVTKGEGKVGEVDVTEGSVLFVGCGELVGVKAGKGEGLEVFRAFVEA